MQWLHLKLKYLSKLIQKIINELNYLILQYQK